MPERSLSRSNRALTVLTALLALPAIYFVVSLHSAKPVQANAVQAASAPDNALSSLEALARTEPTLEHRINLSQAYIQQGQYGQAVEVLTPLLVEVPRSAIAWNNLCVARTLQLNFSLAIDACNRGIQVDPSYQLLRNNLKWAESERDRTVKTLAAQETTAPAQRDGAFYLSEGLNQLHLGAYTQAIAAWKRAAQLDSGSALPWNNIGIAEMMQQHYAEARADFLHAGTLDPQSQLVRNNLAWADRSLQQAR